jgi:hypothetical protein
MESTNKIVRLKTVSDTADMVRGLLPQMQGMQNSVSGLPIAGTTDIVQVSMPGETKPKRGRPKKVVEPVAYGAPPTKEQIKANIELLDEVDAATKALQEKYFQENLASSSVANQIAIENAPTTVAIKDLQDRVEELSKEGEKAIEKRDLERDHAKSERERAKLRSKLKARIDQVHEEILDNDQINDVTKQEFLESINDIKDRINDKGSDLVEDYDQDLADLAMYEQYSKRRVKKVHNTALLDRVEQMILEIAGNTAMTDENARSTVGQVRRDWCHSGGLQTYHEDWPREA